MTLKIISPEDIVFEGEITSVTLPGQMGSFTVLRNHASLVSTLVSGTINYKDINGEENTLPVESGIVDVDNNIVSVCLY